LFARRNISIVPLFILALVSLDVNVAVAAEDDGGTTSIFRMGAGAKNIAFGGALCAYWKDSYSSLWNPALLYYSEKNEVGLFHTSLFDESVTYSSLISSYPFVDAGVISAGAIQLRVGGIERRDSENRVLPGELRNTQTRYFVGYANRIVSGLTGGLLLKLDRYAQGQYLANGFGVDVGFAVRNAISSSVIDEISFGLSFENIIEPTVSLVSEEVGDPRGIRSGISISRHISRSVDDRVTLALDFSRSRYSEATIHIGAGYQIKRLMAVNFGWDDGDVTFGCGFNVRYLDIDYAYRSTELGGNHLFSLTLRFGHSRTEKLAERQKRREEMLAKELESKITSYEQSFISTALETAEKNLANGEYGKALENYQRVLLWEPDNEQAKVGVRMSRAFIYVQRGDSLYSLGSYTDALFSYREAESNYSTPDIVERISTCEKKIGEIADRKRIVGEIFTHSLDLYAEKRWLEAIKGFEKVLELDPSNEAAGTYISRAKEKINSERELLLSRVDALVKGKSFVKAISLLRVAIDKNPSDTLLANRLNSVMADKRSYLARTAVKRLKKRETKRKTITNEEMERFRNDYEAGIEYFKHGNFRLAVSKWEPVWRVAPDFEKVEEYLIKAYQYYGMELYTAHKYEEALDTWQNILRIDPNNEKATRYINRTREELNKLRGFSG